MTINIKIGQRTEVKILCYLKFKTRKKGKFEIQNSSLEVLSYWLLWGNTITEATLIKESISLGASLQFQRLSLLPSRLEADKHGTGAVLRALHPDPSAACRKIHTVDDTLYYRHL